MPRKKVLARALLVALVAQCSLPLALEQGENPAAPEKGEEPTLDSKLEEQVRVRLAEIQVLVTDRKGAPLLGLTADDIVLKEDGDERELAFVEPFATTSVRGKALPQGAPVIVEGEDGTTSTETVVIMPPPAIRRIVLLFDAYNGRRQDREEWVSAAREWVMTEMREEDRVAIALHRRGAIDTLIPFTNNKVTLGTALEGSGFLSSIPDHDYISDVRRALNDLETCENAYEPRYCASSALQPYIFEWKTRTERSLDAFRRFSASLGAIPGRKVVMLMSGGLLSDPGEMAVQTILARFGTDVLDTRSLRFSMRRNMQFEILEMLRVATHYDVTFFSFDTRPSHIATNESFDVEDRVKLHERRMSDPFTEVFESGRATLTTIATMSGGRAMHGTRVAENLSTAAAAIEGLYTIGFYRSPTASGMPKVKVRVNRRGARVTYPDRYDPRRHTPRASRLEMGLARCEVRPDGIAMPVIVQLPLTELSFEASGDGGFEETDRSSRSAALSVFVEAITPEGERVAEVYEVVEIALSKEEVDRRAGKRFGHTVTLVVPEGSYRVRARVSDLAHAFEADKAIDVSLDSEGRATPGLRASASRQKQP